MSQAEDKLKALCLVIPEAPVPVATYVPFRQEGNNIYLSGQGPRKPDGSYHLGTVGQDVTTEEAYEHARLTGLNLLSAAKLAAGSLDRIRVLKLFGMVKAVPNVSDHPKVINGCSDLFVAVLGETASTRAQPSASARCRTA
jgi:enamine deaminase RidA (YjgF/YER057c/UK114 family)